MPDEVAPLATNVNALLETNEEMIRRARAGRRPRPRTENASGHTIALDAAGQDGRLVIEQCERMRRQIDYQLAKARAAASCISGARAIRIGPAIRAIVSAVERLHHDRGLAFELVDTNLETMVVCEAEDLDEILGNLIDNAGKWARARVKFTVAAPREGFAQISVEDDGSGMPPQARERVFEVGERLDELTPGTGLGLAIVREVVTLYGGRTWIDESSLGGAAVHVELPVEGQITV